MYFRHPSKTATTPISTSPSPPPKPTARAILIDTEPKVLNKCLLPHSPLNFKYDPGLSCKVGDGGGAGNNWARGNALWEREEVREQIMDTIRREIERNDRLSSFHIISSLAGGTGSGLGCAVTCGVKDFFSSSGLCMNTVVSPFSAGEVIVQDYNAALSMASLLKSSDGIVAMDNEVAIRKCRKGWRIERPLMSDVNRMMAEGIGGAIKESYGSREDEASGSRPRGVAELLAGCVPHQSYKIVNVTHAPTMPESSVEFTRDTWEGGIVGRLRQMNRTGCEVEQEIKWGAKEETQKTVASMLVLRGDGGLPPNLSRPPTLFEPRRSPHLPPPSPPSHKSPPLPPSNRTDDVWEVPLTPFHDSSYPPFISPPPFSCSRSYLNYVGDKHGCLCSNSNLPALRALSPIAGAMRKHSARAYLWQYEKHGVGEAEWEEVWNTGTEATGNYGRL
ncbi:hypothetical protein TrRE_jg9587 [Triparma retinervis]|uniref:Tubulin delta chain n=1 Tax=Triparma retinervis TaxID=2557542 RepID=A0A9W7E2Y8_9STRA|nr:hypothetical protein TrRE_jg9587 [Triparma retinervis]